MPIGRSLTRRARPSPSGAAERGLTGASPEGANAPAGEPPPPCGGALPRARSDRPSRVTHLRREPGPRTPTVHLSGEAVNERGSCNDRTPAAPAPH
jgi:hypothetical protein